jgi:hypothetical protein
MWMFSGRSQYTAICQFDFPNFPVADCRDIAKNVNGNTFPCKVLDEFLQRFKLIQHVLYKFNWFRINLFISSYKLYLEAAPEYTLPESMSLWLQTLVFMYVTLVEDQRLKHENGTLYRQGDVISGSIYNIVVQLNAYVPCIQQFSY